MQTDLFATATRLTSVTKSYTTSSILKASDSIIPREPAGPRGCSEEKHEKGRLVRRTLDLIAKGTLQIIILPNTKGPDI